MDLEEGGGGGGVDWSFLYGQSQCFQVYSGHQIHSAQSTAPRPARILPTAVSPEFALFDQDASRDRENKVILPSSLIGPVVGLGEKDMQGVLSLPKLLRIT